MLASCHDGKGAMRSGLVLSGAVKVLSLREVVAKAARRKALVLRVANRKVPRVLSPRKVARVLVRRAVRAAFGRSVRAWVQGVVARATAR